MSISSVMISALHSSTYRIIVCLKEKKEEEEEEGGTFETGNSH